MKRIIFGVASFLFVLLLLPASILTQDAPILQYAVKFVCGRSPGKPVAPGIYNTAINIHNPTEAVVPFRWKVATAPETERPGEVSSFSENRLKGDQAMEIDCTSILRHAHSNQGFLTGFAVIQSKVDLDVVAVYTAAGSTNRVETMDVERVPARRELGCVGPDLIVENILFPEWDPPTHRSVISAVIRNIGNADAAPSLARLIDPSTLQGPGGPPYNDVVQVPALAPGASFTAVFHLPYWVFNPDATLEVTADYKNDIKECNENNNKKNFQGIG